MNEYIDERVIHFMRVLTAIGVEKETILQMCVLLKTEEAMEGATNRLVHMTYKPSVQEALNICGQVKEENFAEEVAKQING